MSEPALDVLKYQLPPPGSVPFRTPTWEGTIGNAVKHVLWEIDIGNDSCMVLASLAGIWYQVHQNVRTVEARYQDLVNSTKIELYTNLGGTDIAAGGGTPYLQPGSYEKQHFLLIYPLTIFKAGYSAVDTYQNPERFTGPFVIGGARKIAITIRAEIIGYAAAAAVGNFAGSIWGWMMPDPEGIWKDHLR